MSDTDALGDHDSLKTAMGTAAAAAALDVATDAIPAMAREATTSFLRSNKRNVLVALIVLVALGWFLNRKKTARPANS